MRSEISPDDLHVLIHEADRAARRFLSDNSANQKMRSDCSSGFKGVRRRPNNRFEASIRKNGKKTHLGDFCSAEEAHAAYCEAAKKTHGRFFRSA